MRVNRRPVAFPGIVVLLSGLVLGGPSSAATSWKGTPQEAFLESPIVRKFQCVTCHTITDQGGTVGPILNLVGLRRPEEWIRRWLKDPNAVKPGTKMPKFPFTTDEYEMAIGYLTAMKRPLHTDEILASGKSSVEIGHDLFDDLECFSCHRVGAEGRFVGPDLTWVGIRKSSDWERSWLRNPQEMKPDTFMPNFHMPAAAADHIAEYLHTFRGQANEDARAWELRINFMVNNNDVRRGEMIWKRLACWSCHGEEGRGGVQNPNAAAGHEQIPDLRSVRDTETMEEFGARLAAGRTVPAVGADAVPQPFPCPKYEGALDEQELSDLYAYVSSLAPPKLRWKIK